MNKFKKIKSNIPCMDNGIMPEVFGQYEIKIKGIKRILFGWFYPDVNCFCTSYKMLIENVTHWKPIPCNN